MESGEIERVIFTLPDLVPIQPDMLRLVSEIDEFKGHWRAWQSLTRENLQGLRRVATIESIGSSTRIEGSRLTDREVEVLRLVSTGLHNRDIASILFIAESTVKTHVEHIIGKLGVSDRVQAAVWAARHGLISSAE